MTKQRSKATIVETFERYVATLETIPVNADGEPNLSALARECGFDRKRFLTNNMLSAALSVAIAEKGLSRPQQQDRGDKALREAKNEIKALRERIQILQAEIVMKNELICKLQSDEGGKTVEGIASRAAKLFLETGRMAR